MKKQQQQKQPLQKESDKIITVCIEVHRILGKGLFEGIYKDAIAHEFRLQNISYEREKKFDVRYKEIILAHTFCADFVVSGKIILDVKSQKELIDDYHKWDLNYLRLSECPAGLLVNFGGNSLVTKRIVL